MGRTQEVTPYYIRTSEGATFYVESLNEAIKEFACATGYRLTLTEGDEELVLRRSEWGPPGITAEFVADGSFTHRSKEAVTVTDNKTADFSND